MNKAETLSNTLLAIVLLLVVVLAVGCGGGGGGGGSKTQNQNPGGGGSAQTQDYGLIMGNVKDDQGTALGGVTVAAAGKSTTTNEQGFFTLANLEETDRLVVNFSLQGYNTNTSVTKILTGNASYIETVLAEVASTTTFWSGAGVTHGETYTAAGASVAIQPNSLVDASGASFNGNATIEITPFDPTTENGMKCFPGEFKGETTSGETVPIESFGFMDVTIKDTSGNPLQIAPGRTAEIVVPVPSSLSYRAPNSIPLWYFDHDDGKWHEDGAAALNLSGTAYEGAVTHFTPWNCDKDWSWADMAWVRGRVIDAVTGLPVFGARILITGDNWSAGESGTFMDGTFEIPVMPNRQGTLKASKGDISSDTHYINTLGSSQYLEMGDVLIGGIPAVVITLTWKENPDDLDAHLTIPDGAAHSHLYWNTPGLELDGAKLNTDDTTSFGPEIMTIYQLRNGVYRYCVHHYAGSGTIASSPAAVVAEVRGLGVYNFPVPAGATGAKDAWRVFDITVSGGKVVDVTTVNDYLHNIDTADVTAFSP